jgi:Major tropism determinant N-terminal domain
MAVTQISKIAVRRGRKENLPQLAGGELGWAVDTQQLFIGNGSLSEGAPAEGNTEIITERYLTGNPNTFTQIPLFNNTSVATIFYTFSAADHPAGVIQYSVARNGAYGVGQITYAYDGASTVTTTVSNVGGDQGITFGASVASGNIVFTYTATATGHDAVLKFKRVDYI